MNAPERRAAALAPASTVVLLEGRRELGISSRLILCFLRHLPEEDAMRTLAEALAFRERFCAVGLDSSEAGHPPSKFARVFRRLEDHNLKRLMAAGLCVTVNSDDPAYLGGYLGENYRACGRALDLSKEDIRRLAANSISASFLPEAEKARWLASVRGFQ